MTDGAGRPFVFLRCSHTNPQHFKRKPSGVEVDWGRWETRRSRLRPSTISESEPLVRDLACPPPTASVRSRHGPPSHPSSRARTRVRPRPRRPSSSPGPCRSGWPSRREIWQASRPHPNRLTMAQPCFGLLLLRRRSHGQVLRSWWHSYQRGPTQILPLDGWPPVPQQRLAPSAMPHSMTPFRRRRRSFRSQRSATLTQTRPRGPAPRPAHPAFRRAMPTTPRRRSRAHTSRPQRAT